MTHYQQKIFSDLLDVNFMIDENKDNEQLVKYLTIAYYSLREKLREDMGSNEYASFIRQGQEMFAPAK